MAMLNYLSKFEAVFAALNQEQQSAVQHIEGPVLVIAGPGTGKTQILAARIARILLETDALPENILCLTYTDAGAVAMRKRLQEFIGPDAYRVQIATFHGFCNKVIQENLDVFGFRNLDPVSDLETVEFLRELIDGLPKNNPLKRYTGDVYFEINRLKSLFQLMKKEDWSPDFLLEKVEAYTKDLPERPEFLYKRAGKDKAGNAYKKGDLKKDALQEAIQKMELLKAAIAQYEHFQQKLLSNHRYDFADMILWVIKAFQENASLLSDYQEKYQYVLVDEFQDTSGSQNDLLSLVISYWDIPNVFAVGDDDQSIYRFQGANIENIQNFITQFGSHLKRVTLTHNYRSSQAILDAAQSLISRNSQRIAQDKYLVASHPERTQITLKPQVVAYYNPVHESSDICKQIEALQAEGVPLNEIAVIYRNHQQAEEMAANLQSRNIAINARKRLDILHEPIVQKISLVMQFLAAETEKAFSGENFLFEILHFKEFAIPTLEIARLSVNIARENFSERNTSWREELAKIARKKQGDLFEQQTQGVRFTHFSQTIEGLIQSALNQTPQESIHQIIRDCGLLGSALSHQEKTWQMEVLRTFFDFIKTECQKKPQHKLKSLSQLIRMMLDNKIPLNAEKIIYSETGVNFLTAHSSKGLEFEYVFMIACNSKAWDEAKRNRSYQLPDNLFAITGDETEENRRLFYVAMTRAKKQLHMSFVEQDLQRKDLEPSRFIAEITEDKSILIERKITSEEELLNFTHSVFDKNEEANLPKNIIDNGFTDSLLEKYSLSVTHLNHYLKCPISFYFNNFIKVPAPKSASMTFGSAIHFALEQLFKKMNSSEDKKFAGEDILLNDFRWFMKRNQDSFTEADFKRRIEYGEEILPAYYQFYIAQWNKVTSIEKSYKNVLVKGVPINGKIDKMEFDGNHVNVVDYKTGAYKNAKNKFGRPNLEAVEAARTKDAEPKFEDKYGGDYWRQAVFYKILMDNDATKNWEMKSSEFDFVEPISNSGKYTFHKEKINIIPEDIQIVQEQIVQVYQKIKLKEFTQGCGKEDCVWCNFSKNYYANNTESDQFKNWQDPEIDSN